MVSRSELSTRSMPQGEDPTGVLSAPSLAGWALEREAPMRELSTWLLVCTCVVSRVGLGVSVQEEGGGESWAPASV